MSCKFQNKLEKTNPAECLVFRSDDNFQLYGKVNRDSALILGSFKSRKIIENKQYAIKENEMTLHSLQKKINQGKPLVGHVNKCCY